MALRTPPSWQQQGSHPAENDRLTMQAIFATTGIVGASSLAVTAQGTPNMTVNVAAGWASIVGTSTSTQGVYVAYNDATTILAITAANASLPRIDLVCATVNDAYYSGLINNVTFQVIAGTPAASPVAPTLPANSISLATIAVAAAVTSITSGNITDTRVQTTSNLPFATLTGTQTLTNKTLTAPTISGGVSYSNQLVSPFELSTISATAATGTINYDASTQAILYYTTNASANFTLNIRASASVTLNAFMAIGQVITVTFMNTNGATAYYPTVYQIDGAAVTPKWLGGTAPTGGNASAIDIYTLTIIKTGSAAFTVLASQTKAA